MRNEMHQQYDNICAELAKARAEEELDFAKIRRLRRKLEKWQLKYGANAPVR
jgi:hypothetical protein